MGRKPCCDKESGLLRRGPWSCEEDKLLVGYIQEHGHGSWRSLPKNAGLRRCGKSCRLRWTNYLRPGVRRGPFSPEEEATIIQLHGVIGNKWAAIASQLPAGRTDNEVKNFWNTHLKKRLRQSECLGLSPIGKPDFSSLKPVKMEHDESPATRHMVQWENARVEAESRLSMQSSLLRSSTSGSFQSDPILQLWNSEVGESFRNIKGIDDGNARGSVNSHSQASSSVKLECSSHTDYVQTTPIKAGTSCDSSCDQEDAYKPSLKVVAGLDSLSSNEFSDSSDNALKLLLDLPGGNELDFAQGEQGESFCDFLDYRCK